MDHRRLLFPVHLQFFSGEKTEKPTEHKLSEARKKGQVAKSADLSPAFLIAGVFLLFLAAGPWMLSIFLNMLRETFQSYLLWEVNFENLEVIMKQLAFESMKIVGPVLAFCLLSGLLVTYSQVGILFTVEPLQMKLEKLNPIEGFKRIASLRSLVELCKSILKISVGALGAYLILKDTTNQLLQLSQQTPESILSFTAWSVFKIGLLIGIFLIVLGLLDYFYQRFEHLKNLRMSKQDIKDEHKKMEGDPLIKSKIKEKQRQMAMRRMMQEIPKADVIITNPTHFAVAIKYEAKTMAAPTVIAKGQDYVALKIREIAKQHRIVTMENKPLARALYSQVDIGQQIPEELFKAVAEVLAYVYKLQGKAK